MNEMKGTAEEVATRISAMQSLAPAKLISDVVPALLSYVDNQCIYRFCNQAYSSWFGLSSQEIIGKPMRAVLGEEAWSTIAPHINKALEGSKAEFEAEARYARGGARWVHAVYTPHFDDRHAVIGIVVLVTDISTQKQHEQQLTAQARLLDLASDAIIVRDLENRVIYWNKGAEEIYGFSSSDALGRNKFELLKTQFSELRERSHAALYRMGRWSGELIHTRRDGVRVEVSARWVLNRNDEGTPKAILEIEDLTERKRAEESLHAKEQQLQRIADLTPIGLTECTSDLKYKFVNRAYAEMLGLPPGQIAGRLIAEVMGEAGFATIEPYVTRVLRGERVEYETDVPLNNVGRRSLRVVYVPQRNPHGRVEGWVASISDVTERKRLENAIVESSRHNAAMYQLTGILNRATKIEEMYEAALDCIVSLLNCQRASVLLFDNGGVMHFVAWRGLSEVYRSAVGGHSPWSPGQAEPDAIPIADVSSAGFDARLTQVLEQEGIGALCFVPLSYQGKVIGKFMTYYDQPHSFTTQELELALAISRQLASAVQRKRAENSLRESETLFRTLAESAPVMIWISGADKWCTFFNTSWLQFTGRTLEQEIGKGWSDGVHPQDFERCLDIYNTSFDARHPFQIEYRRRRHDGEYRWVLDHGIPRVTDSSIFIGFIGSCLDITDRKRAEEALRDADRRKDEFLATLAHELRNPLAPLRNGLEVLKLTQGDQARMEQARSMMVRQLGQLVRLVDDLMDVSRIRQGKIVLQRELLDVSEIVDNALETCKDLIRQGGHEVVVTLPEQPVYLSGDRLRLVQVFSNLLGNAAKYTKNGGRLWLRVENQQEQVLISVKDSGIGIPEHMLSRIFEMFTQVDHSLEKAQGGVGIGLTIAKQLVEVHGGTLKAHSEGPGKGSEFVVLLPASASTTTEPRPEQTSESEKGMSIRKRILIADDNEDSLTSLELMLTMMGHEVRTAGDGNEAVELANELHPELVLLDIGMPILNGYEACLQIRGQLWSRKIKPVIVALTGWSHQEAKDKSQSSGFDHHLVKPIDPTELFGLLKESEPKRGLSHYG